MAKTKQQRNEQSAAIMAKKADSVREIGAIPAVADEARKERCRLDLGLFLKTYMPETFYLPWGPNHLVVIDKIQTCVLEGGQFAEAMPRGEGKTQTCAGAAFWAAAYGHRRYIDIIGAKADNASDIQEIY
jgi:hypothetical protein